MPRIMYSFLVGERKKRAEAKLSHNQHPRLQKKRPRRCSQSIHTRVIIYDAAQASTLTALRVGKTASDSLRG